MKCIICGTNNWKYLFDAHDRMFGFPGKFSEHKCRSCGFVRLLPKLTNIQLKKYYPSSDYYSYNNNAQLSFFGKLRNYLVVHYYKPNPVSLLLGLFLKVPAMPKPVQNGKILDIGCGSGETLSLLQTAGWEVYGIDIDKKAIQTAKDRGIRNVVVGPYERLLDYKDNYFDVIRLYHVIEHIDDPGNCFRLAYKKLKKGGQIIVGTPNESSIVANLTKQYWYNLDCPRHLYLFSPSTLESIASKNLFRDCMIKFASAGGIIGSIQYLLRERLNAPQLDLINKPWLVMLVYPIEKILDFFKTGDVIVLTGNK